MAHIKPEHLLEPRDYHQWVKVQREGDDGSCVMAADDDVVFESLSKRAWMDVLLQLVKVSMQARLFIYLFFVYLLFILFY